MTTHLEPGMLIKGGEPGWQTVREIIAIDRLTAPGSVTFRSHRTSRGMTCNRTYTTDLQAFCAWARCEVGQFPATEPVNLARKGETC